jgi:hypothetical protein
MDMFTNADIFIDYIYQLIKATQRVERVHILWGHKPIGSLSQQHVSANLRYYQYDQMATN